MSCLMLLTLPVSIQALLLKNGISPLFEHFEKGSNALYFIRLLGQTEDAVKSLTKAADILQITHGKNSPFVKQLLWKLEEARAEASYKRSSEDGKESPSMNHVYT